MLTFQQCIADFNQAASDQAPVGIDDAKALLEDPEVEQILARLIKAIFPYSDLIMALNHALDSEDTAEQRDMKVELATSDLWPLLAASHRLEGESPYSSLLTSRNTIVLCKLVSLSRIFGLIFSLKASCFACFFRARPVPRRPLSTPTTCCASRLLETLWAASPMRPR